MGKVAGLALVKQRSNLPLAALLQPSQSWSGDEALSDIYSLGAVGYELLTGQTVFSGASLGDVILQLVRVSPETPSARLKRPVSPDLEDLLLRCLAKSPSARPSAVALEEALGRCVSTGTWSRSAAEAWWTRQFGSPKQQQGVSPGY